LQRKYLYYFFYISAYSVIIRLEKSHLCKK